VRETVTVGSCAESVCKIAVALFGPVELGVRTNGTCSVAPAAMEAAVVIDAANSGSLGASIESSVTVEEARLVSAIVWFEATPTATEPKSSERLLSKGGSEPWPHAA
jgi:hypothetical protein